MNKNEQGAWAVVFIASLIGSARSDHAASTVVAAALDIADVALAAFKERGIDVNDLPGA